MTSEAVEYDRCIDCDGTGHYPTGKQCRSCVGTPGRVPKGDGEPITKSGAAENVVWRSNAADPPPKAGRYLVAYRTPSASNGGWGNRIDVEGYTVSGGWTNDERSTYPIQWWAEIPEPPK